MDNIQEKFVAERQLTWEEFILWIKDEKWLIAVDPSNYLQFSNRSKDRGDRFRFEYDFIFYKKDNLIVDYWNGWFRLRIRYEEQEKIIDSIDEETGEVYYKTYYDGYTDIEETRGTGVFGYSTYYIAPLTIKKLL